MTTPSTMGRIITDLRERLSDAERDAERSNDEIMSYGAGYDRGFADAIKEILSSITGEDEPEATQ